MLVMVRACFVACGCRLCPLLAPNAANGQTGPTPTTRDAKKPGAPDIRPNLVMMIPMAGAMATAHLNLRGPRGHHQDLIPLAALEVVEVDRHRTHTEEDPHKEGPTMEGRHPEMATHHGRQLEERKRQPQDLQQTLAQDQLPCHHRPRHQVQMNLL